MPTMSLDELAEIEVRDAMERKRKEDEIEAKQAAEDPDDEEIMERERQRTMEFDDFKDYNPKGRGNT